MSYAACYALSAVLSCVGLRSHPQCVSMSSHPCCVSLCSHCSCVKVAMLHDAALVSITVISWRIRHRHQITWCRMVPHKTKRGAIALERLKTFEGVPPPYDKVKRLVVPDALKVLRLQHGHKFCKLGDLASSVSHTLLLLSTCLHYSEWQQLQMSIFMSRAARLELYAGLLRYFIPSSDPCMQITSYGCCHAEMQGLA